MEQKFTPPSVRSIAQLLISQILLGIAGALFVTSGMGADAYNMITQGLSQRLGIAVGTGAILLQASLLLVVLLTDRKQIGLGTLTAIFLVGVVMNLVYTPLQTLVQLGGLAMQIVYMLAAPVVAGLGIALAQEVALGLAPNDALPLILTNALHGRVSYRVVRICYDLTEFVIGLLLGGLFGIGTIVGALLIGPSVQFFFTWRTRHTHRKMAQPQNKAISSDQASA